MMSRVMSSCFACLLYLSYLRTNSFTCCPCMMCVIVLGYLLANRGNEQLMLLLTISSNSNVSMSKFECLQGLALCVFALNYLKVYVINVCLFFIQITQVMSTNKHSVILQLISYTYHNTKLFLYIVHPLLFRYLDLV